MNVQTIKIAAKETLNKVAAKSPSILTGMSIASTVTSVVLTTQATIKATKIVEEMKKTDENGDIILPKKTEIVKNCWTLYVSPVIAMSTSIACAIGSNSVNCKRNAALAGAYALSADALKQYKEKTKELIGEKKMSDVRDKIASENYKDGLEEKTIIMTGKGNVLIKDLSSGQYFRSTMEAVNAAINQANRDMTVDGTISLNDVYYYLGLANTSLGSKMYWKIDDGFIDVNFGCAITDDNEPCLTMEFNTLPVYKYDY